MHKGVFEKYFPFPFDKISKNVEAKQCILHSFLIMKFSLYFSPNVSPNDIFIASNFSPDEFGLCYILCHCIVLYSSMTLIRHFLNKKSIWRRQWVIFNIQMKVVVSKESNSTANEGKWQFNRFIIYYLNIVPMANDNFWKVKKMWKKMCVKKMRSWGSNLRR